MIKAVIFDVDGVLLDSFNANWEFYKNLMEANHYPASTKEQYKSLVHLSLRDSIEILTGLKDNNKIEKIAKQMDVIDAPPPRINEDAEQALAVLSSKYKLGVATSRVRAYAFEPPLNTLERLFICSIAYEDTERHKPDPEPLLLAASKLKTNPNECIYIGDTENDLKAATAAGMKFINYAKEEMVAGDFPKTKSFMELPEIISRF